LVSELRIVKVRALLFYLITGCGFRPGFWIVHGRKYQGSGCCYIMGGKEMHCNKACFNPYRRILGSVVD
jgi:hypothetical protein